jgi:hypothetical protein
MVLVEIMRVWDGHCNKQASVPAQELTCLELATVEPAATMQWRIAQ